MRLAALALAVLVVCAPACGDDSPTSTGEEWPTGAHFTSKPEPAFVSVYQWRLGERFDVGEAVTPGSLWLPAGNYQAQFHAEGYAPRTIAFEVEENDQAPVEVYAELQLLPEP